MHPVFDRPASPTRKETRRAGKRPEHSQDDSETRALVQVHLARAVGALDDLVAQQPSREDPRWLVARERLVSGLQQVVDSELERLKRLG